MAGRRAQRARGHGRHRRPDVVRLRDPFLGDPLLRLRERTRMSKRLDAIVIGAGPYRLAAAAALRSAGVDPHVFGEPMAFWMEHMPKCMLLRSPGGASHSVDPGGPAPRGDCDSVDGCAGARPIPL